MVAHNALLNIRDQIDKLPEGENRPLFVTVDGSFCNRFFLRDLPKNMIVIARARKDMKLFKPVEHATSSPKGGRHRIYGERLPTPDEIRKDDSYPWKKARIFAAGKYHQLKYKVISPVLRQKGTGKKRCRLSIIAPLRYRKNKHSKLLYREPAYLLVLDEDIPEAVILQYYFPRWDIEVNHRDEKSLMGLGDAQVRSPESVERNPQFTVAVYSLLLLASIKAFGEKRSDDYLPLPKWRKQTERRPSTLDIISQFRREVLLAQLNRELDRNTSPQKENKNRRQKPKSHIEARKMRFDGNERSQQNAFFLPVNILSALLYADS